MFVTSFVRNPLFLACVMKLTLAQLCFAVLMLAVEKHRSTPFAPLGVGITLFACMLWSLPLTGGAVNTARAFGPAVVTRFDRTHWIYWCVHPRGHCCSRKLTTSSNYRLGPTMGAFLASAVYIVAKRSHYWTFAPDQDTTDHRRSPTNPLISPAPTQARVSTGNSDAGLMGQIHRDPLSRTEAGQNL